MIRNLKALIKLGHIESILWPVLFVFVPIDFLSGLEVRFVLDLVILDNDSLAISLIEVIDESGRLVALLALLTVAVDFVHGLTTLALAAVVDFLSLLRVENVWAHSGEPAVGHDVE